MKINLLILVVFLSILIYANIDYLHGISGMTLRDGGLGCICHSLQPNDSVTVWIEGPDSVYTSDSAYFKIYMTGGPAVAGGFDLAVFYGSLSSVDTLTHIIAGDLTHTQPNPFVNDTAFWNFLYTAPDSLLTDTLYSVANSVNLDGIPSDFDQWNFGGNFMIQVIDNPVNIKNEKLHPEEFVLYQNYPNPFNPSTKLSFVISNSSFVSLKVYDVAGNEVATLVNEQQSAGTYEVEFKASQFSSGIYFYQLKVDEFIQTKKMVLLR